MQKILLGNDFPVSLITKASGPLIFFPMDILMLKGICQNAFHIISFWDNPETIQEASKLLEIDVSPNISNSLLFLEDEQFIVNRDKFDICFILSAIEYKQHFLWSAKFCMFLDHLKSFSDKNNKNDIDDFLNPFPNDIQFSKLELSINVSKFLNHVKHHLTIFQKTVINNKTKK